MGTTTAGILLRTMTVRLGLQQEGVACPAEDVKAATKVLVTKLSHLDNDEMIDVLIDGQLVTYRRASSGEILAQFSSDRLPQE